MIYWIWLAQLKGYGPASKRKLIGTFGSPREVYNALAEKLPKEKLSLEEAKKTFDICSRKGIYITPYKEYGIMDRNDLPIILYCRGEFKKGRKSVGIVGSRRCTDYGKTVTDTIARKLASDGYTIVSGMAKGVDSYAHRAAIAVGGYTVAVLGVGIDICYPAEHRALYESIIEKGLVISEYPPGVHAGIGTFPQRNRIIAAFSDSVIVTEAGRSSGSLITAADCLRYGKNLYAVPGRIDERSSEGTNSLIFEQKAKMYVHGCMDEEDGQMCIPGIFCEENERNSVQAAIVSEVNKSGGRAALPDLVAYLNVGKESLYNELTEMELLDIVKVEGDTVWLQR